MRAQVNAWIRAGRTGEFVTLAQKVEILDRSYQIAAQMFVAMLPLILVLTVLITGGQQYLARGMIRRFELGGYAAQSVQDLLRSQSGQIYWFGVLFSVYAAFSLSKRVSRAYTTIWKVPQLQVRDQWRGLVWIVVQLAMIASASGLRRLAWQSGPIVAFLTLCGLIAAWATAEYLSQLLLTKGQVARRRLVQASAVVAIGKSATSLWALWYMSHSMNRQAELYGALGVVFSLFTYLLVLSATMLVCTLAVAVATDPEFATNSNAETETKA
jgi:uncharacterized BrkB/YihY/UPF0761 family membrane protein